MQVVLVDEFLHAKGKIVSVSIFIPFPKFGLVNLVARQNSRI